MLQGQLPSDRGWYLPLLTAVDMNDFEAFLRHWLEGKDFDVRSGYSGASQPLTWLVGTHLQPAQRLEDGVGIFPTEVGPVLGLSYEGGALTFTLQMQMEVTFEAQKQHLLIEYPVPSADPSVTRIWEVHIFLKSKS